MNGSVGTCAWCDEPATTEVEVVAATTRVTSTLSGKRSSFVPARRLPACAAHGNPDPSPAKRAAKGIEGQIDIFQALGGDAA